VIAAGSTDGSIGLFDLEIEKLVKIPPIEKGVAIVDIKWDTLSDIYILAANMNGSIRLIDISTQEHVRSFEREITGEIQSLCWLPFAPGSFATANSRTGTLKIWNASQSKPIERLRLHSTAFHSFTMIPNSERALCSFVDGSVCLYHMKKKQKGESHSVSARLDEDEKYIRATNY